MEEKYLGLSEEAIRSLERFCKMLAIDMPEVTDKKREPKAVEPTSKKTNQFQRQAKIGEATSASPKMLKHIEGLSDKANQSLQKLYDLIGEEYCAENIFYTEQSEDDRISALVEEISKNIAKRIEEEETELKKESIELKSKKGYPILSVRGKVGDDTKVERFTEPKKKMLLTRLAQRIGYNRGFFDDIEDAYFNGLISKEEVDESKNADNWFDRSLYRRVQRYEDVMEDVAVKKGWTAFKWGLLTVLLAGSLAIANITKNELNEWKEDVFRVVTIENARENELLDAQSLILQVTENTDYEFEFLSREELLDAALRIPVIERKKSIGLYKTARMRLKDQELLDEILDETYGDELKQFTPEQIRDLKQLAYEFLFENEEKQKQIRDPQFFDSRDNSEIIDNTETTTTGNYNINYDFEIGG